MGIISFKKFSTLGCLLLVMALTLGASAPALAAQPDSDRYIVSFLDIIGPGVAENPSQHVHIRIPHGFNIGGARQPPGCLNSQHSHLTEEVFIVHSGTWAFRTGVNAGAGEIVLRPGDVISLPVDTFRGFENVGGGPGFSVRDSGRR